MFWCGFYNFSLSLFENGHDITAFFYVRKSSCVHPVFNLQQNICTSTTPGGTQYKSPYGDVLQTWVKKSASWYIRAHTTK